MSSTLIFGSNSIFGKIDRFTSLGMDVKLDKALGLTSDPIESKLGEISQQTAKESEPRAIIWGRVRPIGGNLIHCQEPIKRMVKESVDSGGKGGSSKKTQKVEHVFRTYALGVCEGPITAFARIWRNNKLVYDARGNDWGRANNGVFLKAYRLYLGAWTQMPSPDLEAIWGAGNVPAYRGTAYMVALNEDLTDMSGAVPQWLFEVERAEGYALTSRPYGMEEIEALDAHAMPSALSLRDGIVNGGGDAEALDARAMPVAITLRDMVKAVTPVEALDASATPSALVLRDVVKTSGYTDALDATAQATGIVLRNVVVATSYDVEALSVTAAVTELSLIG
jgi:hypothetical protein